MTDVRHVVVHVEVFSTVSVVEPDTVSLNQMNRFVVEQTVGRAQQSGTSFSEVRAKLGQRRLQRKGGGFILNRWAVFFVHIRARLADTGHLDRLILVIEVNFEYSTREQELRLRLQAFMEEHIYPNESLHREQVEAGDRWEPPAIIGDLKALAQKAVDLAPTAPHYVLLGQACYRNKDAAAALAAIERAIELDPGNVQTRRIYERLQQEQRQ